MSQTEAHIGRLVPVLANEDESRDDLMKKVLVGLGRPLSDPDDIYTDLRSWFDEATEYKYLFHQGNLWKIEDKELDDGQDINIANLNIDGTVSYVSTFYNGGTYLNEMLREALDNLSDDAPGFVLVPTEEYKSLVEDSIFLGKLRAAGVDNWEGYEIAFEKE
jgi:hypothetical protein